MNLLQSLGAVVGEQREFVGMSRAELARKSHTHANTILNVEKGTHAPSIALVWEIAHALDMYPTDLVRLVEEYMEATR